jgi:hypothetical protein
MTLLKLDEPLPQKVLDEMAKFPHVLFVKQLELP